MATPELPQGVHDGQEEPQDLRMAVLDSLEAVLRVPEGAPLDPDLLSTLVSQVQELLVRPVHGAQLPSTDQVGSRGPVASLQQWPTKCILALLARALLPGLRYAGAPAVPRGRRPMETAGGAVSAGADRQVCRVRCALVR